MYIQSVNSEYLINPSFYTLKDQRRNVEIREDLNIYNLNEKIEGNR